MRANGQRYSDDGARAARGASAKESTQEAQRGHGEPAEGRVGHARDRFLERREVVQQQAGREARERAGAARQAAATSVAWRTRKSAVFHGERQAHDAEPRGQRAPGKDPELLRPAGEVRAGPAATAGSRGPAGRRWRGWRSRHSGWAGRKNTCSQSARPRAAHRRCSARSLPRRRRLAGLRATGSQHEEYARSPAYGVGGHGRDARQQQPVGRAQRSPGCARPERPGPRPAAAGSPPRARAGRPAPAALRRRGAGPGACSSQYCRIES